jgi:hypothetical protein
MQAQVATFVIVALITKGSGTPIQHGVEMVGWPELDDGEDDGDKLELLDVSDEDELDGLTLGDGDDDGELGAESELVRDDEVIGVGDFEELDVDSDEDEDTGQHMRLKQKSAPVE